MCAAENVTNILCGSKLVIKKAQPTDSSRYQITVRNKYGTDSVQIDVFVIGMTIWFLYSLVYIRFLLQLPDI